MKATNTIQAAIVAIFGTILVLVLIYGDLKN